MKCLLLSLLLFSLTSCSCKKEEENWSQLDMWKMAQKFDPSVEVVPIPDSSEGRLKRVLCENYRSEGCTKGTGKRIKVRLVEILVLRYNNARNACLAALEVGQWHARNWLFDDVTDEPVLIDFAQKVYQARKPEKEEDCVF